MSRLAKKLKVRTDFNEIVKRTLSAKNPERYVIDTFGVSYPTARKFVSEISGSIIDNDAIAFVDKYCTRLDMVMDISNNPSTRNLIEIGNEISKFRTSVLRTLFYKFTNNKTTAPDFLIIKALKYSIQEKYYKNIYKKDISPELKNITFNLIKDCS